MIKAPYVTLALVMATQCWITDTATASTIVSVVPGATTIGAGESFTVDVNVSNVTDLFGYQFDLSFNPAVLSVGAVTEGALLPTGGSTLFIPGTNDNLNGVSSATADTLIGPIPGVNGSGTLAAFTFSTIAPGTSTINVSNLELLDSSVNPIVAGVTDASVTVSPVPLPTTWGLLAIGVAMLVCAHVCCAPRRQGLNR